MKFIILASMKPGDFRPRTLTQPIVVQDVVTRLDKLTKEVKQHPAKQLTIVDGHHRAKSL